MTDIVKMIEDLVEKKTLSLDAIGAVEAVRKTAVDLKAQLLRTETTIETQRKQQEVLIEENSKLKSRELSVIEREKKMIELERDCAVAKAVQATYKDQFDRMFANRQTRELHNQAVWLMNPSGNFPQQHTNSDNVTHEEG